MKFSIHFILLLLVTEYSSAQLDTLLHNNLNRTYLIHLPENMEPSEEVPLVIGMHGGFGNAAQFERQSQLSNKADEENFIVVYPEGITSPTGVTTWNAGACCGYASFVDIDDVGFVSALIDTLITTYNIDEQRIYAAGMSNGGFMSYRLACELSDKIAAIAPVAASMTMEQCTPSRPVPILHVHSFVDFNVPYEGGVGQGASTQYSPPLDSVMNIWASKNGCSILNDTLMQNSELTSIRWHDCDCDTEIRIMMTEDGGHSWAGGPGTLLGDVPSEYISATDVMWDFFSEHSLGCRSASLDQNFTSEPLLYPNPTNDYLHIRNFELKDIEIFIYDLFGNEILNVKNQSKLSLAELAPSTYIVKIRIGDTIRSQEFIKI